ncbi:hypothetical protein HDU76_003825 [Blyttiomyces sp. JEL0837]|nr:hypothetical protein HDU76_003825 [Blyttiomyces sp. JEL0837]
MTLQQALSQAASLNLDLVLVNEKQSPPVCRLLVKLEAENPSSRKGGGKRERVNAVNAGAENSTEVEQDQTQSRKSTKSGTGTNKPKDTKEIEIKNSISDHDLGIKLKKVGELLEKGHAVRFTIVENTRTPRKTESEIMRELDSAIAGVGSKAGNMAIQGKKKTIMLSTISAKKKSQ